MHKYFLLQIKVRVFKHLFYFAPKQHSLALEGSRENSGLVTGVAQLIKNSSKTTALCN